MLSQQGYMRLYAHQKLYQDVSDALTSNLAIAKCRRLVSSANGHNKENRLSEPYQNILRNCRNLLHTIAPL